jgi:hypothetical protein
VAVQLLKSIEACPSPTAAELAHEDVDVLVGEHVGRE